MQALEALVRLGLPVKPVEPRLPQVVDSPCKRLAGEAVEHRQEVLVHPAEAAEELHK